MYSEPLADSDRVARNGRCARLLPRWLPEIGRRGINRSALLGAVGHETADMAEMLLRWGADPELPRDVTPPWTAAKLRSDEMVRLLLRHGANPNARCWADRSDMDTSPLRIAVERRAGLETLRVLLSHGGDPTLTNYGGEAPYDLAGGGVVVRDLLCGWNAVRCRENMGGMGKGRHRMSVKFCR
jgi:hypothetical protein